MEMYRAWVCVGIVSHYLRQVSVRCSFCVCVTAPHDQGNGGEYQSEDSVFLLSMVSSVSIRRIFCLASFSLVFLVFVSHCAGYRVTCKRMSLSKAPRRNNRTWHNIGGVVKVWD